MIFFKEKDWKNIILFLGCIFSILVVGYSIFTIGQATIHSDSASSMLLADSIVKNKSRFPVEWNYAYGEFWTFGHFTFTFLPTVLMSNQPLARMLGSFLMVLCTMASVVFLSKKGFKNDSWMLIIPLSFLFLTTETDMLLYQCAYAINLLVMCVCATCVGNFWDAPFSKENRKYSIFYAVLMFDEAICGARYMGEQMLPMFLACGIIAYAYAVKKDGKVEKEYLKNLGQTLAIVVIPAVLGFVVNKWMATWHNVNNKATNQTVFVDSLGEAWNNLWETVQNLFINFGFVGGENLFSILGIRNMISIVMCVIVCFVVPVLQWKKLKDESFQVQLFFVFVMAHNLVMFMLAILFDKMEPRYILSTVLAFIVLSSRYIYVYWICQKSFRQYVWAGLFFFATIIECAGLCLDSEGWQDKLAYERSVAQALVDHNLTKGYGTFWNSYKYELYSDKKVRFGCINLYDSNFQDYRWLVDNSVFDINEGNTFIMLDDSEYAEFAGVIPSYINTPIDEFMAGSYHVLVFDHDIMLDCNNGLRDGIVSPKELIPFGEGATVDATGVILPAETYTIGPYSELEAGEYTVTIYGDSFDLCDYAPVSESKFETIYFEGIERTNNEITFKLVLSEDLDDLEFRIFNVAGQGEVVVNKISVK